MPGWSRRIPFKVDIGGVIHIMGSALYSRPEAAIRELIQNAHDAVMRRRQLDVTYQGRIDIRQDCQRQTLEFRDDGVGLSPEEAERYLSTLGIGVTGLLKGRASSASPADAGEDLIGMFGIGLFSAFMLADQLIVESRRMDHAEGVRWKAGEGADIELASFDQPHTGTTVRLALKPEYHSLVDDAELLERLVKEFADFLPVPIFLNAGSARVNVVQSAWFDPTPDREAIELELASYFDESPLDVIPVQLSRPPMIGALYVSPRRTPGFAGDAVVTATVRRMVISRQIQRLLPEWAGFLRGVLELRECSPTASREDLVRDRAFSDARQALEQHLFAHFEHLAENDPSRLEAILSWHRYSWAGAALSEPRLRKLLQRTYKFPTSAGLLTFEQILGRSAADPILHSDFESVVWYNTDRRQEGWINSLFADHSAPCVHALRSFEESLLAAMVGDAQEKGPTDLRFASPGSAGFAAEILGVDDLCELSAEWQDYFGIAGARIRCTSFRSGQPVVAFLNEHHELLRTFEETGYFVTWGVLARTQEEAETVALAWQSRAFPLPAEVEEVTSDGHGYRDTPGIVWQGFRHRSTG